MFVFTFKIVLLPCIARTMARVKNLMVVIILPVIVPMVFLVVLVNI